MTDRTIEKLKHLLRPLATRIANSIARGVVQLADDGTKLQLLQVGLMAGETVDKAEHHQPYGFSSVPLAGAEVVTVFPNGDRSHPLVLAASDRRYRPRGGQAGQVLLYTDEGDLVKLGRGHVISLETSGTVKLGSSSAAESAIKGTSRNTAEQTFLSALTTAFAAINTYALTIQPVSDPTNAATPVLTTALLTTAAAAINAFKTAAGNALSAKVKLE